MPDIIPPIDIGRASQRPGQVKLQRLPLLLFAGGVVGAIVFWQVPALHRILENLGQAGYFGAFLAGLLYATSFASATATVIFTQIPEEFHPWLVGIIGGFGALIYDFVVFAIARRTSRLEFVSQLMGRIHHHSRWPRWLTVLLGALVLASPLPDELAAGFFGFSNVSRTQFFLISFTCNTIGIQIITGLF